MKFFQPITIVGGGLAGLITGITLRRAAVPVTIWEAGHYPRHRVCGEFISGRGVRVLEEMGLLPILKAAGARPAATVMFTSKGQSPLRQILPEPAWCLSRFKLDHLLAEIFQNEGGILLSGQRWRDPLANEGLVRATGRRMQTEVQGWRWLGLKAHARNVTLDTDLEMHFVARGYVGLCRVEDNRVNVSGLFWSRDAETGLGTRWREKLRGDPDTYLYKRLAKAEFIEDSFCAIAGLNPMPQVCEPTDECAVGDAVTMIPPVTGNGMSMAFESAALAAPLLAAYSAGQLSWKEMHAKLTMNYQTAFQTRLRWAWWLQRGLSTDGVREGIFWLAANMPLIWRCGYARTR